MSRSREQARLPESDRRSRRRAGLVCAVGRKAGGEPSRSMRCPGGGERLRRLPRRADNVISRWPPRSCWYECRWPKGPESPVGRLDNGRPVRENPCTAPAASTAGFSVVPNGKMVPRVALYIDGFNLYYGKLRGKPLLKWLDLEAFGRTLAPRQELVKVRYFTAWISGKTDPASQHRQQVYVRSLRAMPLVQTHFGHFETREKDRRLVAPAPGQPRTVRIFQTDEKGSDVNLATWLLLDGVDGVYDEAIVVTNDSDLEEPIRQANTRFGRVHIVSPHTLTKKAPYTHIYTLESAATTYRSLLEAELASSQLPDVVTLPTGKTVHRPAAWR